MTTIHSQSGTPGAGGSFLSNWKISKKITTGFVCVILVLAVVAGSSYLSLNTINTKMSEEISISNFRQEVMVANIDFLSFHYTFVDFMIGGDENKTKLLPALKSVVTRDLDKLQKSAPQTEFKEMAGEADKQFADYSRLIETAFSLKLEQRRLYTLSLIHI